MHILSNTPAEEQMSMVDNFHANRNPPTMTSMLDDLSGRGSAQCRSRSSGWKQIKIKEEVQEERLKKRSYDNLEKAKGRLEAKRKSWDRFKEDLEKEVEGLGGEAAESPHQIVLFCTLWIRTTSPYRTSW